MSTAYAEVPAPKPVEQILDPVALVLGDALREGIWTAAATASRSQQRALGFSELGTACQRRLGYRLRGTPASHWADPLKSTVGTGVHLILAEYFRRLDAGTGRYLVEHPVSYRGIHGTVDLFDRRRKVAVDWKTKSLAKIKRARREGPSPDYITQVHGYGTALRSQGEDVTHVAIVYVPVDGELGDIYVWVERLDQAVVDKAIARVEDIGSRSQPASSIPASPSPLCGWCPFYNPLLAEASATACPGSNEIKEIAS